MNKAKKIIIVGAGPGGLTSSMILAKRGFDVTIIEKDSYVGGRNKPIRLNGYTFDTGPTFLMLTFILEDIFKQAGKNVHDYLSFTKLDPMYRLQFYDTRITTTTNLAKMRDQIKSLFPGNEDGFDRFIKKESQRFKYLFPCLQKDYSSLSAFIDPIFLKAAPYLSAGKTVYDNLGNYFDNDYLKIAFTFQSKYLGMSPWTCPALFTMLSYMEYGYGIYHVTGGLNAISQKMADVVKEHGGTIRLNSTVQQLIIQNRSVRGVMLQNGEQLFADDVIINADFPHAMENLVPKGILKKYSSKNLLKKKYSCSTFMLYLGLKKIYDLNHHNIFFAKDYKSNIHDIFKHVLSDDFSFYIQNASVTDPTLAPKGKSTMYILVPIPNNFSGINWEERKKGYRDIVLDKVISRTGFSDLREQIEVEHINSPFEWENSYNVFKAAEFGLSHNLSQLLYLRPHNKFEELKNCYLVGGSTHPGSGLPTIYESGLISADLISKSYGLPGRSRLPLPL